MEEGSSVILTKDVPLRAWSGRSLGRGASGRIIRRKETPNGPLCAVEFERGLQVWISPAILSIVEGKPQ